MQIGDKVQVPGTVRDVKDGNVLVATDDGHEYWFIEKHVAVVEAAPTVEAEAPAAPEPPEPATVPATPAVPHRGAVRGR